MKKGFKPFFFFSRAACKEAGRAPEQGWCPIAVHAAWGWGANLLAQSCLSSNRLRSLWHASASRMASCHKIWGSLLSGTGTRSAALATPHAVPGSAGTGELAEVCPRTAVDMVMKVGARKTHGIYRQRLSQFWEVTQQSTENTPESPIACPREWNVPHLVLLKPQVQGTDWMEQNMSLESTSGVMQSSHVLYCAVTSKICLKLHLLVSNRPLEGCQGCTNTNFLSKLIDGQVRE